jgi:hypothetical protein
MSTYAIDSARTNERLSAFMSEIGASEPVDNFFPRIPVFKALMDKAKMQDGGRQIILPIDSGKNTTIKTFSDYDLFDTSRQDTVETVGYPMVNVGGTMTISWEELREVSGQDHQIFDMLKHLRKNTMSSIMDFVATDLFASSQAVDKVSSLATSILATGALGGLNQSTDSDWASVVTASGSFPAQGLKDMRTTWNAIVDQGGGQPDILCTTPTAYQLYEAEVDPDVIYMMSMAQNDPAAVGNRGFGGGLRFNGAAILRDLKCNAGVLYMINSENCYFVVDTAGNFSVGEFITPANQEVSVAKVKFRANLIFDRRRSHGKLTGIAA